MPFVNDQYIKNVLHKPRRAFDSLHPNIPTGLSRKKIQAYFETHPIDEIYTVSSTVLGKIIGVKDQAIRDYKKENLRPKKGYRTYIGKYKSYERRLILEGRMKRPEKQKTIQDIQNLW